MRLSQFIRDNVEPILVEWEMFACTMIPPAETMSVAELRDHAAVVLSVTTASAFLVIRANGSWVSISPALRGYQL
jgi:hypothetical protein